MNELALYQFISTHLHTYVKKYNKKGQLLRSLCNRMDLADPFAFNDTLESRLLTQSATTITPSLIQVNERFVFSVIPTLDSFLIVGPVRLTNHNYLRESIHIEFKNMDWEPFVYYLEFEDYIQTIRFLYNLHRDDILTESDFIKICCIDELDDIRMNQNLSSMVFEHQENAKHHNPYDQELREGASIENGDLEQLEQSISEDYTGEIGTLSKDKVRNLKNVCIVVITLASRAAMRGGLNPELAYSLSDNYIQQIEENSDYGNLLHLTRNAERYYTKLVHEQKMKSSHLNSPHIDPRINHCKDYIFSHLHDRITIEDLGEALHLNPQYLSQLFKESEGVPPSTYILNEKINRAKNLLSYSDYSYIEIATYLGFSSQSHLGMQFRKLTGYTLKQYRDKYGIHQ